MSYNIRMQFLFQITKISTSPLFRIINEEWIWIKTIAQIFQFAFSAAAEGDFVRSA